MTQGEAGAFTQRWRTHDRGHEGLAAEGSEGARTCCALVDAMPWSARVVVVRSPLQATHQAARLATRLHQAEPTLAALTPPSGRGKRHSTDAAARVAALALVRKAYRVAGWRRMPWATQVEQPTQYVGRGRGSVRRATRVLQQTRSHITHLTRQADPLAALSQRFGWQALVTKAGPQRLSLQEAVLGDRHESRVERLFHRRKSCVHSAPLLVKLNEPIEGLTSLLTLGVRGGTVTECVRRRSRERAQASLPGLHPENKRQRTDKPTAERVLRACAGISLTILKHAAGEDMLRRLPPLSE